MFSNTHAYIAEKVYTYLRDYNGITLAKGFFKYGSIKPDFVPRLVNIGHYKEESMNFVQEEIVKLSSIPYREEKEYLKHYSIRLGIIIHYLSDFFCHAHNSKSLKQDMFKHFLYEAKLESLLGKFEPETILSSIKLVPALNKENIINYLNIKLENYKETKISHLNDLKWAIEASYSTCLFVTNASLGKTNVAVT